MAGMEEETAMVAEEVEVLEIALVVEVLEEAEWAGEIAMVVVVVTKKIIINQTQTLLHHRVRECAIVMNRPSCKFNILFFVNQAKKNNFR